MTTHTHGNGCFGKIDGRLLCERGGFIPTSGAATTERRVVDQPPPIPNASPAIWALVIADMEERDQTGRARYGTPLQAHNGRDSLVDAYQEALDLVVYLRQAIAERDG